MVTIKTVVPRRAETQGAASLTRSQKVISILLLLFYLAMIGITIATSPFVTSIQTEALTIEPATLLNIAAPFAGCRDP